MRMTVDILIYKVSRILQQDLIIGLEICFKRKVSDTNSHKIHLNEVLYLSPSHRLPMI